MRSKSRIQEMNDHVGYMYLHSPVFYYPVFFFAFGFTISNNQDFVVRMFTVAFRKIINA